MAHLDKAHRELFKREPDECFEAFETLHAACRRRHEESVEHWQLPQLLEPEGNGVLRLSLDDGTPCSLNDWSFGQLCGLCGISRQTINRLQPATAALAIRETLPSASKPIQLLKTGHGARAVHGVSYTRLWNDELLDVIAEFRSDFEPPQRAFNGHGTGLYCGEQDLFVFLVDPTGWTEIGDEQFAPGFFAWNSEVGRRSLGIQTFWYQRICGNHIVWDAVEVVEFSRKHTTHVREALDDIRRHIERLIARRDERRDRFSSVIEKAMHEPFGEDADSVVKLLGEQGIPARLAKRALPNAMRSGRATLFSLVDALTRISGSITFAGDRSELDAKISQLLSLAA
ncbi:MAG: DUF932 domain-containing protein [Planctomycetota bacterium]|nr:MAG: DUF932 domain-containing protein [Planctomycetota bacterium]REK28054.1 MAG: DUF932 domain-containing protein [Planctomycetota bacterium]REK37581.1 MAG: DUF932 domain-containing protein [Planctomycetota bacterium]